MRANHSNVMVSTTAVAASLILIPATAGFITPAAISQQPPRADVSRFADVADSENQSISFAPSVGIAEQQGQVNIDEIEECSLPTQRGNRMSESIPFLECPPTLMESDLAGNFGFDPFGFASSKEKLLEYREAEIKHARLAMLAAVGWPISELKDRDIASFFDAPSTLDGLNRVPSLLNGGMDKIDPRFWGFCLGLSAAIDMYGISKSRREASDYFPGNLGFDPLNLFPPDAERREKMKLAEIKHGRVAMIGVAVYAFEEYLTKTAVIDPVFLAQFRN